MYTDDGYEYQCICDEYDEDKDECRGCLLFDKRLSDFNALCDGLVLRVLNSSAYKSNKIPEPYFCSAEMHNTGYLKHWHGREVDLMILDEMGDQTTAAFLYLKGDGSIGNKYCNTLTLPTSFWLGHALKMDDSERDHLIKYIDGSFGTVTWNKSDTKCIKVDNPFKSYITFRKIICGNIIKNTLIKSKFYERVCGKLWHPNNVLGKRARDDYVKDFKFP